MIGKKLDGKYEIVDQLGAGGMGAVYEAINVATRGRVAIKVILGELAADGSLVARFQREARAAGSIESRHIARVIDAGKDPESNAPYLVMELLRGEDVDSLMKRLGPLRPTLALRIVAQALAGLERAHAAEVVHRDIKPANLYIAQSDGGQRVVKLVDFGIAKVKDDVTASREFSLTQTASLLGSPLYMSPEQARTSKAVDGRADLWSLGVVLYQMLSGRAPHASAGSLTELLLAICTEPAQPVQERAPWVPTEIARLVTRAIEIEQGKRFRTAREMLAEIAAVVPDWQQLDEAMLVPMTDEERAFVAPKLEPALELGVSTGPTSTRELPREQPGILEAPTVAPKIRAVPKTDPADAGTSSGDYERTALAPNVPAANETSTPGVGAISAPGASMPDGLASTKSETTSSTTVGSKSRALPLAIGGVVVLGLAGAIAFGTRSTANERPSGVVAVPSEPAPLVTTSAAPPVATTAAPAPSASPAPVVEAAPSATASTRSPRPAAPPVRSHAPAVVEPATAAAPTTAKSAQPPPPPPKPSAAPASTSPISRDFN